MAGGSRVSYAAQTAFILSTTVCENILFGAPFDRERYEKVLDACCLRPDLLQWPASDLTKIGERGVTMSGRAVYANPDVGLFDDILSALDAGTSQTLFDNLFDTVHDEDSLLHKSGVVLVTHACAALTSTGGQNPGAGGWKVNLLRNNLGRELQSVEPESSHATLNSMRSSLQLSAMDATTATSTVTKATIGNCER